MSLRQKKQLLRIAAAAVLFVLGLLIPHSVASLILLFAAYALIGWDVLKEAVEGIIRGQVFDENFLMAIATVGAIMIGEYHEAAAVMLFYQIGEWFQQYAVGKSRASISALMDLRPDTAEVEREGSLISVHPEEVEIGEIMIARPGDRIALDGVVVEGTSTLDTSALTGESLPRDVSVEDEVLSGCINQSGMLRIRVARPYSDSTVARILDMVENATDQKARVESFITRFARFYTPVVCGAALLLFMLPSLFDGQWMQWGYRALSFLVVSCPCALVISVPLTFFGGIGGASRHGILIKGSNDLERLAKARIAVFDKTGTLTQGHFRVEKVLAVNADENTILRLAAAVEGASSHPISRSICEACPVSQEPVVQIQEMPGEGIKGIQNGHTICAGNRRWMNRNGIVIPTDLPDGTLVHVARDSVYLGAVVVGDTIKPEAEEAVRRLKKCGICKTVMLSGDTVHAAQAVAQQLSIDEVHAQLLPTDKMAHLEQLLQQKKADEVLVYVGDGINDAPVLARADVGIAMGALGSDAAVEAADIVLMDDDPRKVALAVDISRHTLSIAHQNIFFAIGIKLLVLALVAAGAAGMWLAIFADVGVSVLAILNAMRALTIRKA